MDEILLCKKDNRQEALDHDEHAVGVYKFESDDAETMLVGHVPIELSMLLSRFLKASEKNAVEVKVCGKRRREVGLVILGHYKARTKSRSHCKILDRELNYMKTKYTILQNKRMRRCGVAPPPIIFERLKLPQQIICRRKGNLSESPNHQKYSENILISRFYEQFSRNSRILGHFWKFEKISNS